MKVKEPIFDYVSPDIDYQIKKGDSLTVLKKIEDGKFDLILTSPPSIGLHINGIGGTVVENNVTMWKNQVWKTRSRCFTACEIATKRITKSIFQMRRWLLPPVWQIAM